jgi:hypothetical protein
VPDIIHYHPDNVSVNEQYLSKLNYGMKALGVHIGNDIYITFMDVNFPQYEGNVPTVYLNRLDDDPDFRTKRSKGVETNFLKRIQKYNDNNHLTFSKRTLYFV